MRIATLILLFSVVISAFAQFPPAADSVGSTAIHADSSVIIDWASMCTVQRGYMDISDTSMGKTNFGSVNNAVGKADNIVVSLGDGGSAILTFNNPIANGQGFDFAVFENSFNDEFLELAFVEVSSDGQNFFRFPSVSLTQTDSQVASFATLNPEKINNLAGKYRVMFGTPFDLDEIPDSPLLNKNNVTHVRITDVVGSVNPQYASYDSEGNIINDPWPTPFNIGGFDLDAVGVINSASNIPENKETSDTFIYPVPAETILKVKPGREFSKGYSVIFYNIHGFKAFVFNSNYSEATIDISALPAGIYEIVITGNNLSKSGRIVKL